MMRKPGHEALEEEEIVDGLHALITAVRSLSINVRHLTRAINEAKHKRFHPMFLSVTEIHPRRFAMQMPPIHMFDTEKVQLTVSPVKPNGEPDENVVVTWASSAPDQVGVEPIGDLGHSCWVTTPLDTGSATITVDAPGYNPSTVDVSYEPGIPRELNLQVGTPIPDVE